MFSTALLLLAACSAASRSSARLNVEQRVDHIDVVAREPMVVEHPNGALFVAGYGEPCPTLWKSEDRGATWTLRDGSLGVVTPIQNAAAQRYGFTWWRFR